MKKQVIEYANEENQALGNWLLKKVDGINIMHKAKNAKELETLVMEYAKKKGSVAGMDCNFDDDDSEGLGWVTFEDLFKEVKSRL